MNTPKHLHIYSLNGAVIYSTPAGKPRAGDYIPYAHSMLTDHLKVPVEVFDSPLMTADGDFGVFYMGPLSGFYCFTKDEDAPTLSSELAVSILSHRDVGADS